jgi:hypothetical protein
MSKITKRRTLSETAAALAAKPQPHKLWRTLPAESFDEARRFEVMGHIALHMSTIKEWKDAVGGDAACAVKIALSMEIPDEITYPVDARMTLLLYCVLKGSAGAALVLAHLLRKMPLDADVKNRLATSWLVSNLGVVHPAALEARRRGSYARRSIASHLLGLGDAL